MLPKLKAKRIAEQRRNYHEADKYLLAVIILLVLFGLISLSSASSVYAYDRWGDAYYLLKRQLFGLFIGISVFLFLAKTDYQYWKKSAAFFLVGSIGLLVLVFIPGIRAEYGTAQSWINIFGYSLQPSELVKISFLLYLAAWLEKRKDELSELTRGFGPFLILISIIAVLMLLQPDFGTFSILMATSIIVYFVGGGKISHIVGVLLGGVILFLIMIQMMPYQMDRIRCMLDPGYSRNDTCYQINQTLIAVGSGGIMGRGLGESRQKYMYIPEVSGDSIFAVIAEEVGLIFSTVLISLYGLFFYRGYLIAKAAPDFFGRNLAIGIVSWISLQAFINIGGIINLIPMTGVPLPFVSYGGSSILATLAACGILLNISKQTKRI